MYSSFVLRTKCEGWWRVILHIANSLIKHSMSSKSEEVMQVNRVAPDGLLVFQVSYSPKRLFQKYDPKQFDNLFLCVLIDYHISDNSHKRSRSQHFYGIALASIIRDDIQLVGKSPLQVDWCVTFDIDNLSKEESERNSINASSKRVCSNVKKSINRMKPIQFLDPCTNLNSSVQSLTNNNNPDNKRWQCPYREIRVL
jgi:hypothetical protein